MNRLLLIILLTAATVAGQAQEISDLQGSMHSGGNIYAVVAVIGVTLLGLLIYLFVVDRKLSRLEKELNAKS